MLFAWFHPSDIFRLVWIHLFSFRGPSVIWWVCLKIWYPHFQWIIIHYYHLNGNLGVYPIFRQIHMYTSLMIPKKMEHCFDHYVSRDVPSIWLDPLRIIQIYIYLYIHIYIYTYIYIYMCKYSAGEIQLLVSQITILAAAAP